MPQFDMLSFPPGRGILAVQGAGYYSIPTLAAGATITPGTNAYGSYAQISAGEPKPIFIVGIQVLLSSPAADVSYAQLAIGLGTSGAETQVSELKLQAFDFVTAVGEAAYPTIMLPVFIPVPGGVRIAGKAALAAGTTTIIASLIAIAQGDLILLP